MARAESSLNCTAQGTVTFVAAGCIEIELARVARCHGCEGTCRWYGEGASAHLTVPTQRVFAVGAPVTLVVADRELLRGAMLVYGVPLAGIAGGALLGFAAWGSDLGTAAGTAAGLAAALAAAWVLRARLERHARHALTVVPAS